MLVGSVVLGWLHFFGEPPELVELRLELHNPCADEDPCTVDVWHRFKGQCIHIPDVLCTKPCSADADCAYPNRPDRCVSSLCVQGQCRHMKIARDECARCGADVPCEGSYCDPRACRHGFCRHAPRTCDDGDAATRDVCDDVLGRCRFQLADGARSCQQTADCGTDHACQQLECRDGLCRLTAASEGCAASDAAPRPCAQNTDCIEKAHDGTCFAGPCEQGYCRMRKVENSECKPCTGDHDCDGSFCLWPICTGTVCVVEQVPFCTDDDPLTADACSEERKGCTHRYEAQPSPRCANAPKDDGNSSTLDICHTETGESVHLPMGAGRCETSDLCWDTYLDASGHCVGRELHCHHDDACPAECDPAKGCVLDPNRDCHCERDADCDLGNPCARVYCMAEDGGACWGTFIDDCIPCQADVDCRVDNWCVLGRCHEGGYCRYEDGFTCDDGDPDTFGFCHGQRDDPCTYERIYDRVTPQ